MKNPTIPLLALALLCATAARAQLTIQPNGKARLGSGYISPSAEGILSIGVEGSKGIYLRGETSNDQSRRGVDVVQLHGSSNTEEFTSRTAFRSYISGARYAYGMWNTVAPSNITSFGYGIRNQFDLNNFRPRSSHYGILNDINFNVDVNRGWLYGIKNEINLNGSSTRGNFYASHNAITGQVTDRSYGVYSDVPSPGFAGYFKGKVAIDGSLTVNGIPVTGSANAKSGSEDVEELTDALEMVLGMKPMKMRKKVVGGAPDEKSGSRKRTNEYGFSAEVLRKLDPSLVTKVYEPALFVSPTVEPRTDEEGNPIPYEPGELDPEKVSRGKNKLSINILQIIPILTQAIGEQQDIIEKLGDGLGRAQEKLAVAEKDAGDADDLRRQLAALTERVRQLEDCTDCATKAPGFGQQLPAGDHLRYYPNPATDQVTVGNDRPGPYTVEVIGPDGRAFATVRSTGQLTRIDTSDWVPGTYLFRILQEGNVSGESAIVIHH